MRRHVQESFDNRWVLPCCEACGRVGKFPNNQCPNCGPISNNNQRGCDNYQHLRNVSEPVSVSVSSTYVSSKGSSPMNEPALVPEIPTDETLPTIFPERLDWAALSASVKDVTGLLLADSGKMGELEAQRLADEDTLLKIYLPTFNNWFDNKFGWFIEIAKRIDAVRLNEARLCKDARGVRAQILGARQTIIDQRAAQERLRIERERLEKERAERAAELAAERAKLAIAPPEQKAEIRQHIEERQTAPLVPAAASTQEALAAVVGSRAPTGLRSASVCWRHVTSLQQLFAYLGSEQGKGSIGSLCRITSTDRASDTVTISFVSLKKDLETVYPGLSNHRGTETANRGR